MPHASRRQFLATTGLVAAAASADARPTPAPPPRPSVAPRATSGDRVEPEWAERFTVTVGPKKADLVGISERVLQAAVDLVASYGGGTVQIQPGTYRLRN